MSNEKTTSCGVASILKGNYVQKSFIEWLNTAWFYLSYYIFQNVDT